MPTEPEKKIEELLKAYASKRREEAGAPLEMSPATRKLLQAEVARRRPRGAAESPSFLQLLMQFWPGMALAVSVVLVVGLIWVFNSKQGSHFDLAQNTEPPQNSFFDRDQAKKDSLATLDDRKGLADNEALPESFGRTLTRREASGLKPGLQTAEGLNGTPFMLSDSGKANEPLQGGQRLGGDLSTGIGGSLGENGRPPIQFGGGGIGSAPPAQRGSDLDPVKLQERLSAKTQNNPAAVAGEKQTDTFGFVTAPNSLAAPNNPSGGAQRGYAYSLGLNPTNPASTRRLAQAGAEAAKQTQAGQLGETELKLRQNNPPAQPPPVGQTALAYSPAEQNIARKIELSQAPSPTAAPGLGRELDGFDRKAGIADAPPPDGNLAASAKPQSTLLSKQLAANFQNQSGNRIHFAQSADVINTGRPSIPYQGGTNVLRSFELEQNGDQIRIYDADGSVYEGRLVTTVGAGFGLADSAGAADKAKRNLSEAELPAAQKDAELRGDKIPRQRNFFQASGTNRSLNQLVVINASLESVAATAPEAEAALPALRPSEPAEKKAQLQPAPSSPASRIQGLARSQPASGPQAVANEVLKIQGIAKVGPTNQVEIKALPAPR